MEKGLGEKLCKGLENNQKIIDNVEGSARKAQGQNSDYEGRGGKQ
jgi:hypothetical protein